MMESTKYVNSYDFYQAKISKFSKFESTSILRVRTRVEKITTPPKKGQWLKEPLALQDGPVPARPVPGAAQPGLAVGFYPQTWACPGFGDAPGTRLGWPGTGQPGPGPCGSAGWPGPVRTPGFSPNIKSNINR